MKARHYLHLCLMLVPFVVGLTCNWILFVQPCAEPAIEKALAIRRRAELEATSATTVTPSNITTNWLEVEGEVELQNNANNDSFSREMAEFDRQFKDNQKELEEALRKLDESVNAIYIERHGPSLAIVATYMHSQVAALNLILFFERKQCCCFWTYFVKWIYPIYISWEAPLYAVVGIVYIIVAGKLCPVAGIAITVAGAFSLIETIRFWVTMCQNCCRKVAPKRDPSKRVYALLAIQALFFVIRYILLIILMVREADTLMFNLAETALLVGFVFINVRHLMREVGVSSKLAFWLLSGGEVSAITTSFVIALFYAITLQIEGLIPALTVIMIAIDVVVYQFFAPAPFPATVRNGGKEEDQIAIIQNEMLKDDVL